MTDMQIQPIRAFKDNYIWMLFSQKKRLAVVIDPGDATPVLDVLKNMHLALEAILVTHHHEDHTAGIPNLQRHFHVSIYNSKTTEKEVYLPGLNCQFSILTIPGHTLDHIAFLWNDALFCGDTLFTAGCGRLFEGRPEQLLSSLKLLSKLPDTTKVYCGHEYTQSNVEFAKLVEPNNPNLILQNNVPSTIGIEKLTNPFLRCSLPSVHDSVEKHSGKKLNSELEVFKELLKWDMETD